jgi:protein TonB
LEVVQTLFSYEQMPRMATFVTAFDPVLNQDGRRLLVAAALSLLLHLALLLGVPVNPASGVRDSVTILSARLEPAPDSAPARNTVPAVVEAIPRPEPADARPQPVAIRAETRTRPQPDPALPAVSGGGIELPLNRDPTYYPARQLDVYPQPLTPIKLDYPATAASARANGRLLVLLLIDEFGVVNDASIVEAEPQGYFEETALEVFRAARFSPAQKQGKPVKSRALLQVNYVYGDSQGAVR